MTVSVAIADFNFSGKELSNLEEDVAKIFGKRGQLCGDTDACEQSRCLSCPSVCEACVEVCPNRANVAIKVPGVQQQQIIHVDGMCNECGNCAVFCPYSEGRPYKDKFTAFWSREDFDNSENEGFLPTEDGFLVRLDGSTAIYNVDDEACGLPENIRKMIVTVRDSYSYLIGA